MSSTFPGERSDRSHYKENDHAGWIYAIGRNIESHIGIVILNEMLYYAWTRYTTQGTNTGSPTSTHGLPYVPFPMFLYSVKACLE